MEPENKVISLILYLFPPVISHTKHQVLFLNSKIFFLASFTLGGGGGKNVKKKTKKKAHMVAQFQDLKNQNFFPFFFLLLSETSKLGFFGIWNLLCGASPCFFFIYFFPLLLVAKILFRDLKISPHLDKYTIYQSYIKYHH